MQWLVKLFKQIFMQCVVMLVRTGYLRTTMMLLKVGYGLSRNRRCYRLMKLFSVTRGADDLLVQCREIYPSRTIRLGQVRRYGIDVDPNDVHQHEHAVTLPALKIMVFRNIGVIGGSEMLCATGDRLLYDELAMGDPNYYGCKAYGIIPAQIFGLYLPAYYDGRVLIAYSAPTDEPIPRAIHLCKDHSSNYFHWLFECLPRAIVALEQPEYADWPLLVDAELPVQNLQALQRLCGDREIIPIPRREMRSVSELVFPSVFSFMHDNYGMPVAAKDLVIAPEAVRLLKNKLQPVTPVLGRKKIYIARDRAKYRRVLNEQQIQDALRAEGFEIVRPEELSFSEQIQLFSDASVIVGPTGAGLSNLVFAPPGCKVIVLAGETRNANYFIFGQLGRLLGQQLVYVTGKARKPWQLHSDYSIDLSKLLDVLTASYLGKRTVGDAYDGYS